AETERALAVHRQGPIRVVGHVHTTRVRIAPDPFDRVAVLQRVPAGGFEQQVDGLDGTFRGTYLIAPSPQAHLHRHRLARPRTAVQLGDVAVGLKHGRIDFRGGTRHGDLRELVLSEPATAE